MLDLITACDFYTVVDSHVSVYVCVYIKLHLRPYFALQCTTRYIWVLVYLRGTVKKCDFFHTGFYHKIKMKLASFYQVSNSYTIRLPIIFPFSVIYLVCIIIDIIFPDLFLLFWKCSLIKDHYIRLLKSTKFELFGRNV